MLVPNRHGSSNSYRYGFQGQEKDDELKGEGNSLNYTFRMHDPRVGRFFAEDPLKKQYPELTPYQFASNRVIDFREIEGLEGADSDLWLNEKRDEVYKNGTEEHIKEYREREKNMVMGIGVVFVSGVTFGLSTPYITSAYSTYSSWFGTTALSNSFAGVGVTGGTGSSIYSLLTFSGMSDLTYTKFGVGFASDICGQFLSGNNEINIFSSAMSGFSVVNPFYANSLGSMGEINISNKGITTGINLFDGKFTSNFTSNYIGGSLSKGFEVSNIGYKAAENGLNLFTGSIIESGENKLSDKLSKTIEATKSEMNNSKRSNGSKKREPIKNEKVKSSIPTTQKVRTDLIKIKS